jgi:lipopolysaccharide export system permease protein
MSFLFSTLGRYLVARMLAGIGTALGVVAASILLVDVVEQLRTVGARADLSLWQALGLTALKAPQLIEQTLPFVVLAGTMIALIQLNRRSELISLRAAGVSAWRFLWPTIAVAGLIGVFSTTILNPMGARLYERFEATRDAFEGRRDSGAMTRNGVWLRQGDDNAQTVIHATSIRANSTTLENVTFFQFQKRPSGPLEFVSRIQAREAELKPSEVWELRDYVEGQARGPTRSAAVLSLPTDLKSTALLDTFISQGTLAFWDLPEIISGANRAGLSPIRYELKFHSLVALPALLAAMAALGAVFSLRLQRLGGMAGYIGIGVGIGFLVYFAGQIAAAFAITEVVPPMVAAWSPALTGFFAALAILSFVDDG